MSEKSQHPAVLVLWNEIAPILSVVANKCVGLTGPQFQRLERNAAILSAVITTGKLPPGIEMRPTEAEVANPADNGKPSTEASVPSMKGPRGGRQQRRREAKVGGKSKQLK